MRSAKISEKGLVDNFESIRVVFWKFNAHSERQRKAKTDLPSLFWKTMLDIFHDIRVPDRTSAVTLSWRVFLVGNIF